jgi:transcriptional regulator with XRE-family HTH domain
MADDGRNPAVQGRRLRLELKRAREAAGLTLEQVAATMDWSVSKIVRIESGAVRVSTNDLKALLGAYRVSDDDRVEEFLAMGKAARDRPWWRRDYSGIAPKRYLEYVEFEQAASATWHFQPFYVPGILQTRDYARDIIWRLTTDMTDEQMSDLLKFRLERQQLLDSAEPPSLSYVLDESVVRRQVGDESVMAGQLSRLIELSGRPNISLQILLFSAGPVEGTQTPFVIHHFPDPADHDVVYLEGTQRDTRVADDPREIERYHQIFHTLQSAALSVHESARFLKDVVSNSR